MGQAVALSSEHIAQLSPPEVEKPGWWRQCWAVGNDLRGLIFIIAIVLGFITGLIFFLLF